MGFLIGKRKKRNLLFNILLDISRIQWASILGGADDLRHELGVGDCLARLHDSDDGGLRLVIAICGDAFVRLFVLFFGFLGLDLIDLDAVFRVGEILVQGECVGVGDVSASRRFG